MTRPFLISLVLLAGLTSAALFSGASAQSGGTIRIIAIDAVTSGNTATSLGALNACVRAEAGQNVTVDLVVDAVPEDRGMIGFEIAIVYTAANLQVNASDSQFLLAAEPPYQPFEGLNDPVPDTDGQYQISVVDLQSNSTPGSNIESGPGVLARITLEAKGTGLATVGPGFNPPNLYPTVLDQNNETIGVDTIGTATIAVGQDCPVPPEATPEVTSLPPITEVFPTTSTSPSAGTPSPTGENGNDGTGSATGGATPTGSGSAVPSRATGGPAVSGGNDDDGGTSTGTVVAAALLAVAGVGFAGGGGWMLYRRRRGGI